MSNIKELKELLMAIAGGRQGDFDVISNIKDNFDELKQLVNSYEPELPVKITDKNGKIKSLLLELARYVYFGKIDEDNFSIDYQDLDDFKDVHEDSCISGFPTLFFKEKGVEYGDDIMEVGFKNGVLYLECESEDTRTGRRIPEEYKDWLIRYLQDALDTLKTTDVHTR